MQKTCVTFLFHSFFVASSVTKGKHSHLKKKVERVFFFSFSFHLTSISLNLIIVKTEVSQSPRAEVSGEFGAPQRVI